ncbi:NAD(P)H-hydrate dehydratase [Weissella paramesenteroides]|uniref:NAD(P)H-hydrate dehydratase n=1 Tax=Weissella paramesenteroides TaxID=1249 RepID=UPI0023F965BF|nr:NAD(P)H-hydrate dehydratase [Weissella paramesenteroides]MDF8375383.1 NAD(P)H-hydrate dehydratase [Weissella paramesenteroides]
MVSELKSDILHEVILRRPDQSHKGDYGRVLLIGGSVQFGGAILMASQASIGAGAGLTTVATDRANLTALHARTPEAMFIDWQDSDQVVENIKKSDVIVIGPGLGTDQQAVDLVKRVFATVTQDQILVVDGSALTIMAENHLMFPRKPYTIATPHQMEWARLSGIQLNYQTEHQLNEVQRQILNLDVLVLKQHHTLIYAQNKLRQLMIGGAYQATGGMGDVLAGTIGGFVGQFKNNHLKAVEAAVYAHSMIAQEMASHSYVVKPSFIADALPNYMARIQSNL